MYRKETGQRWNLHRNSWNKMDSTGLYSTNEMKYVKHKKVSQH